MLDVKKCVKVCMNKYGLNEKEALRIATTDNILLSIEELRYKYDNLKIGTDYPEWITPEEHLKMCYATVWKKYYGDEKLSKGFYSCEDLVMDLYANTLFHLHNYNDKYQLNGILLCRMRNLIRDKTKEVSLYSEVYDWENENITKLNCDDTSNNYNKAVKYNAVSKDTNDVLDLLLSIEDIKNERVKGILLICGYFLANIQEFLSPLVVYYMKCSDKTQQKIYNLGRDDYYFCKAIHKNVDITNKENITIGRILKVFGKRSKSYLDEDLLPYLESIGFINVSL